MEPVYISAAVEGSIDAAVADRLIREVGATPGRVYVRDGKAPLLQRVAAYANAARYAPWLVLVDLDDDAACAPLARQKWLPSVPPGLCFRIVVREIEAWLLADRDRFAAFLGVSPASVPRDPEIIGHPEEQIVSMVTRSPDRFLREDVLPRPASGRKIGPAYTSRMIEFVRAKWSPRDAAANSASLQRALDCLRRLARIAPHLSSREE